MNQPTLQTLLYGQFTPPLASKIRRHTILQEGNKPLPQFVPKAPRPNEQNVTADAMYEFIKANPGVCVSELKDMLNRAPSYIYRVRDILFDQNKIYGVRGKPKRHGGPKTTLFYVKD